MNSKTVSIIGLILLTMSQVLLSFGYEFLMSQRPIDFAHWSLLISALLMFSLWFSLPHNLTKKIGLTLMTIGIGGVIGMCTIDFVLWAAHTNPSLKNDTLSLIMSTKSLQVPFLMIGPSLFYGGMSIATYGLFINHKIPVALINLGAIGIGLGFMIFNNHMLPAVGSLLLLIGFGLLLFGFKKPLTHST